MPSRNPVFTGREQELRDLHAALQTGNAALMPVPAALRGMGGVGKTQTALQYVYLHRSDYSVVFWTRGETPEEFKAQLAALAPELEPPVPIQSDQKVMFEAVCQWFATHADWLLVVDNAEHLSELRDLLPRHPAGRILLTTRETVAPTFAQGIEIEHLDEATGATLLLRRAGILTSAQELEAADAPTQEQAKAVSMELGGLALALDQAGAYMQELGLSAGKYRDYYRKRRQSLHRQYGNPDHVSVSVTFDLALQQVRRLPELGEAAGQLAQVCAFLAADAIPDEIFTAGASALGEPLSGLAGEPLEWTEVCASACRYGLLRRESEPPSLGMHRLAQEVVRDSLSREERRTMAERVALTVNLAFPYPDFPNWPLCERLLPHALVCVQHIADHGLRTDEAAHLLNKTAWYLQHRARYADAEPLLVESLAIYRQFHGVEHPYVSAALSCLGVLYLYMGRYEEAAAHLEEVVAMDRLTIGEDHIDHAHHLDNLAQVYYNQDRYEEAVVLHEQALDISRRALGAQHPHVAIRLANLANVYTSTGRYAEAETLLKEALEIDSKTLGADHPEYATHLQNLAFVYVLWDRPAEAEPLLEQALSIREQAFGPEHPLIAHCHYWLGRLRWGQNNLVEAADHYRRALEIRERTLGPQHRDTVNTRAWLEEAQRRL
jgi:tetratricopeptide (TPR) repeat protein